MPLRTRFTTWLAILLTLTACAPAATPRVPTLTAPPATFTPMPPTATPPPSPSPAPKRTVTFTTADGVTLAGTLYGQGRVAVIFSNMGDKHEDSWAEMAQAVADAGYLALTYEFRYWVDGQLDTTLARHVAEDLSAAADFVRAQGAQQVVLVGASLGGMASAKAGAEVQAAALIIIGSPLSAPSINLHVDDAELQAINAPKLFITSEQDSTVDAEALKAMHALAPDPKELYVYPGRAHGTDLFQTEHGPDLRERLLAFITAHAPAGD